MIKIKNIVLFILGLLMLIFSCSRDEYLSKTSSNTSFESENKKAGFVIVASTPNNSNLVKYFETIPKGIADLRDGFGFQQFNVQDAYNGALFLTNTDGSNGMSKYVVNRNGLIKKEKGFLTFGTVNHIAIKDKNTGVYSDFGNSNKIIVFNPSTMQISGSIDMSSGFRPVNELTSYREFYIRNNKVFAPLASKERPTSYNPLVIHIADIKTGTILDDITVNLEGPVGHNFIFGGRYEDDNGNLYITDRGDLLELAPARLHKINKESFEIDLDYEFDLAKALNPRNLFYRVFNGFYYIGNGKAIASVTSNTPAEGFAILAEVGFDLSKLTLQQIGKIQVILNNAENAFWCIIDLEQKKVTSIEEIPSQNVNHRFTITEYGGKWYLPVSTDSINAYYSYDPVTGETTKAFDVVGGKIIDFINLENNN